VPGFSRSVDVAGVTQDNTLGEQPLKATSSEEGTLLKRIYNMNPVTRTLVVWCLFMAIQWAVFLVGFLTHRSAWMNVQVLTPDTGVRSSLLIIANNLVVVGLIVLGNLFARFGSLSIGGIVLLIQGVVIGWTAGTNGFQYPFATVAEANLNYLKIGLWEVSAYAIICAVTMTKSLNIAETFPPKKWSTTRKVSDIVWDRQEKSLLLVGLAFLVIAAFVEGFFI
jgi:uncharacterized membrane protein SpoIIM required for sporulation